MGTLKNAELSALILHIARFLKSGIPIYNCNVPETATKKKTTEEHRPLQSVLSFIKNVPTYLKNSLFSDAATIEIIYYRIIRAKRQYKWVIM